MPSPPAPWNGAVLSPLGVLLRGGGWILPPRRAIANQFPYGRRPRPGPARKRSRCCYTSGATVQNRARLGDFFLRGRDNGVRNGSDSDNYRGKHEGSGGLQAMLTKLDLVGLLVFTVG